MFTPDALQAFLLCHCCAFSAVGCAFPFAMMAQRLPPFVGVRGLLAAVLCLGGSIGLLVVLLFCLGIARASDQLPAALAGILVAWIGAPTCYYLLRRSLSVLDAPNPGRRF